MQQARSTIRRAPRPKQMTSTSLTSLSLPRSRITQSLIIISAFYSLAGKKIQMRILCWSHALVITTMGEEPRPRVPPLHRELSPQGHFVSSQQCTLIVQSLADNRRRHCLDFGVTNSLYPALHAHCQGTITLVGAHLHPSLRLPPRCHL